MAGPVMLVMMRNEGEGGREGACIWVGLSSFKVYMFNYIHPVGYRAGG